jgi:hypothetical protein
MAEHIATSEIDKRSRPCHCYGAPIDPVWLVLYEGDHPEDRRLVGYQCGHCAHRWPVDDGHDERADG